jgi:hypothetical protein
MKLRIETYESLPCETSTFVVNNVSADVKDFGVTDYESDGDCGCIYHVFKPFRHPPKPVLTKYKITLEEFLEIGDKLEEKLDIHDCGWCK